MYTYVKLLLDPPARDQADAQEEERQREEEVVVPHCADGGEHGQQ